jgi:hypothetical protein
MQATGDDLAVARDAWGLYIGEQQYGSLGYDGNERVLNMRYLLSLLHEYAATLGMIDLAVIPPAGARDDFHSLWGTDELPFFSRYDGLMYFRLTPLGAYHVDIGGLHQAQILQPVLPARRAAYIGVFVVAAHASKLHGLAIDAKNASGGGNLAETDRRRSRVRDAAALRQFYRKVIQVRSFRRPVLRRGGVQGEQSVARGRAMRRHRQAGPLDFLSARTSENQAQFVGGLLSPGDEQAHVQIGVAELVVEGVEASTRSIYAAAGIASSHTSR